LTKKFGKRDYVSDFTLGAKFHLKNQRHKQYDLSTYELNGQLSLAIPSWVGARSISFLPTRLAV